MPTSTLATASNTSSRAAVGQFARGPSENRSDSLSSGLEPTRAHAPVSQSLLETVVRDDTDALNLLFNAASDRVPENNQRSARDGGPNPQASGNHRRRESAGFTASNDASVPESGFQLRADAEDDGLLGRLPVLDPELVTLWSRFPPCSQKLLSPAEVVAYLE